MNLLHNGPLCCMSSWSKNYNVSDEATKTKRDEGLVSVDNVGNHLCWVKWSCDWWCHAPQYDVIVVTLCSRHITSPTRFLYQKSNECGIGLLKLTDISSLTHWAVWSSQSTVLSFHHVSARNLSADNQCDCVEADPAVRHHTWSTDKHGTLNESYKLTHSPSSTVILNHISAHFLIPVLDSPHLCTVLVQWLTLDTIIIITLHTYTHIHLHARCFSLVVVVVVNA